MAFALHSLMAKYQDNLVNYAYDNSLSSIALLLFALASSGWRIGQNGIFRQFA